MIKNFTVFLFGFCIYSSASCQALDNLKSFLLNVDNEFNDLVLNDTIVSERIGEADYDKAISLSGNKALLGLPSDTQEPGSVILYENKSNSWIEVEQFFAPEGEVWFGKSVAIDGDKFVVGVPEGVGKAYVYELYNNNWLMTQKLTVSDPTQDDRLGHAVGIDNNNIILSSLLSHGVGNDTGAVYVFSHNGNDWIEKQKLFASDGFFEDDFGWDIDIENNWIFVGVFSYGDEREDGNGYNSGAVYVYKFDGQNWNELQKIIASDGQEYERFGESVSLSNEWAIIGASGPHYTSINGYAYMFNLNDNTGFWNETQKLLASDGEPSARFGNSVSINDNQVLIGAPGYFYDPLIGKAYRFELNTETDLWDEVQQLVPSSPEIGSYFGENVSLSERFALVSAFSVGVGEVDVFEVDGIFSSDFSQ